MKRRAFLPAAGALPFYGMANVFGDEKKAIRVVLDVKAPEKSRLFLGSDDVAGIPVGLGKKGFLPAGEVFRGGYSLLGKFTVNAILSSRRFEMTEALVQESGKTREWLSENLFSNMSSIDFDGDGKGGEYGECFIGLHPNSSTAKQPFHFGEYKGVFRWYSYAIHGTQDQARIGKCVTGGCINVGSRDMVTLGGALRLNDQITIEANE